MLFQEFKFLVNRNWAKVSLCSVGMPICSLNCFLFSRGNAASAAMLKLCLLIHKSLGNKQLHLSVARTAGVHLSDLCFGPLSKLAGWDLCFWLTAKLNMEKNAPNVTCF